MHLIGRALILVLRAYKLAVSPLLPPACRYYPSCSDYMVQAIAAHGPGWGLWLGTRRVLRCHPWHEGGIDSVPAQRPRLMFGHAPPADPAASRNPHS